MKKLIPIFSILAALLLLAACAPKAPVAEYHKITAEQAKERLDSGDELILLDVAMPKTNGFDVCRQIRITSNVPIIFLTAREQDPILAGQIAHGARFIAKPFSIDQLTHTVNEVLAGN